VADYFAQHRTLVGSLIVSARRATLAPSADPSGPAWPYLTAEQSSPSSALPAYPARESERMPFVPASQPPGRLAVWVSSPTSSPVFLGVAFVSATAWVAATGFLVVATVAGHPLAAAEPGLTVAGLLLPEVSAVLGLIWRRSRHRNTDPRLRHEVAQENRRAARARMKTARHDRRAPGRGPIRRAAGAAAGRIWRPRFPELPRAVGRAISVAGSVTLYAALWIYAWPIAHGHFPWPDGGNAPTLFSQQWSAVLSMIPLYAWCRFACDQLNRSRIFVRLSTRAR
jgi:hypothetical protein